MELKPEMTSTAIAAVAADPAPGKAIRAAYDPLNGMFLAQSARPAHIAEVNLRTLTPFQRALLVIDGTVTKFIEAYQMEPVDVLRLSQTSQRLESDHTWLEVASGTPVISRQVILIGRHSQNLYAFASSLIVPARLPEAIQAELELDGEGLGRILLGSRMETFREVLWFGKERLQQMPAIVRQYSENECTSRTYRIFAGGLPVMLINEKFPTGHDQLPAHH